MRILADERHGCGALRRLLAGVLASGWALAASAAPVGQVVGVVTDAASQLPVAGARVTARSEAALGPRETSTGADGSFLLPLLPPGRYDLEVRAEGFRPGTRTGLVLRVDAMLRANVALEPESVTVDVVVVRSGAPPVVDIGSADPVTVLSREYMSSVPAPRIAQDLAIVAPTAQRDAFGIGFAGSTSPENSYVIDGLRVSDPSTGTLGTPLLSNFVDQVEVKVGAFLPEHGYSSAGIVTTVTRSGSNELHGSLWGNLMPGALTPRGPSTWRNGEAVASYSSPAQGSYDADFGFEVGGPIVVDRLWFYAGLAPQITYDARVGYYQTRVPDPSHPSRATFDDRGQFVMEPLPGSEFTYGSGWSRYFAIAKLTWRPADGHGLSASFLTQPRWDSGQVGVNGAASALSLGSYTNSSNAVLQYTGRIARGAVLLEATAGWYGAPVRQSPRTVDGVPVLSAPLIDWRDTQSLASFAPSVGPACPSVSGPPGLAPGCYVSRWLTGGRGLVSDSDTNRWAGSASVTWLADLAGHHELKGGVQIDYAEYRSSTWRTGGATWQARGRAETVGTGQGYGADMFRMNAFGTLAGAVIDPRGPYRESWTAGAGNPGGLNPDDPAVLQVDTNTWSNGYYLQDRWTIANALTLAFGVRLDTQRMTAPTYAAADPTTPSLDLTGEWGPRVQAIWDFTGSGRGKVQASWGRYYESIPLYVARTAFGSLGGVLGGYQLSSCGLSDGQGYPLSGGPGARGNPASACPNVWGLAAGQGPGPNRTTLTPVPPATAALEVTPGFRGNQGAYAPIAPGLRGQYTDQFGGGAQYEVLPDLSLAVEYLGRRVGTVIQAMSPDEAATSFIANPGASGSWTVPSGPYAGVTYNPRAAVGMDSQTGTAFTVAWPKPVRSYDGVTFSLAKVFSHRWLALASYTWSVLQGNYGGAFRSENARLQPEVTGEWQQASTLSNRTGPLGANRTHQLKANGSYALPVGPDWSVTAGLGLSAASGTPVNAFGGDVLGGLDQTFLLPRGAAGSLPWTVDLDLSAQAAWRLTDASTLRFGIDVFNFLNLSATQWVDQVYTLDTVSPISTASCARHDAASAKDPLAALVSACPDLPYARTQDGQPVAPNLNYGRPAAGPVPTYQLPIRARFSVSLSF